MGAAQARQGVEEEARRAMHWAWCWAVIRERMSRNADWRAGFDRCVGVGWQRKEGMGWVWERVVGVGAVWIVKRKRVGVVVVVVVEVEEEEEEVAMVVWLYGVVWGSCLRWVSSVVAV